MKIKIITLKFDTEQGEFDQTKLNKFVDENQINTLKEEFFEQNGDKYWSILLYYEKAKVSLNDDDKKLYDFIRNWRSEKAKEKGMPVYIILTNEQIVQIVRLKPVTKEELRKVRGFSDNKVKEFGEEIISLFSKISVI
jgi:ribonuclease D